MASYSINQFSQITGLNKILIRTWENRYNFLTPKRTATNIRSYDDNMLNKGIKYAALVENGHKISKLVTYNDEDLNNLIEKELEISKNNDAKYNIYISKFIEATLCFNQKLFNHTYTLCLKELGIIDFYKSVLMKTMNKISILYLNADITSANEHFLSENIRIKIGSEIEKEQSKKGDYTEWVLFLPEHEYHDIGLLFTYLILKKYNRKVIYLGQNTPRESLLQLDNGNQTFLCFLNTKRTQEFSEKLCSFLNNNLAKSNVYVVEKEQLLRKDYTNIRSIKSIEKFIGLLEESRI